MPSIVTAVSPDQLDAMFGTGAAIKILAYLAERPHERSHFRVGLEFYALVEDARVVAVPRCAA